MIANDRASIVPWEDARSGWAGTGRLTAVVSFLFFQFLFIPAARFQGPGLLSGVRVRGWTRLPARAPGVSISHCPAGVPVPP
jgi:hypothetical protein